jgi:hypothetical protein
MKLFVSELVRMRSLHMFFEVGFRRKYLKAMSKITAPYVMVGLFVSYPFFSGLKQLVVSGTIFIDAGIWAQVGDEMCSSTGQAPEMGSKGKLTSNGRHSMKHLRVAYESIDSIRIVSLCPSFEGQGIYQLPISLFWLLASFRGFAAEIQ